MLTGILGFVVGLVALVVAVKWDPVPWLDEQPLLYLALGGGIIAFARPLRTATRAPTKSARFHQVTHAQVDPFDRTRSLRIP